MALSKKTVYFDHLVPYFMTVNDGGATLEHRYNLTPLLQFVASKPFVETKKRVYGEIHMFHKCMYHEDLHLWEIQILHLREKILPGIADDHGEFELIQLEDNQYPAESTTMLYDAINEKLYMQRNLYGTSIRAMASILQQLSPEGTLVALKPIMSGSRIDSINPNKIFRKLILIADSEQLTEPMRNQRLGKICGQFSQYQGKFIKIELGFGRKRNRQLDPRETCALIREAYNFPGTNSLVVSKAEDEDTAFETINLLDDRANYKIRIEYSRGDPITHDRLYRMCIAEWQED